MARMQARRRCWSSMQCRSPWECRCCQTLVPWLQEESRLGWDNCRALDDDRLPCCEQKSPTIFNCHYVVACEGQNARHTAPDRNTSPLLFGTRLVTICRSRRSAIPPKRPVVRLQGPDFGLPIGNVAVTISQGRYEPRSLMKRAPEQ
jgi:hypothetical protein